MEKYRVRVTSKQSVAEEIKDKPKSIRNLTETTLIKLKEIRLTVNGG